MLFCITTSNASDGTCSAYELLLTCCICNMSDVIASLSYHVLTDCDVLPTLRAVTITCTNSDMTKTQSFSLERFLVSACCR